MSEVVIHSVYCEVSDQIVALDGSFCRACSHHLGEEGAQHSEVTPEVLRRAGYVTTPPRDGTEAPEAKAEPGVSARQE